MFRFRSWESYKDFVEEYTVNTKHPFLPPPTEETSKVWRLREVKLVQQPGPAQRRHRHVTLLPRQEKVFVDILRSRVQFLLLRGAEQSLYLITAGGYVVINLPPPLGSSDK